MAEREIEMTGNVDIVLLWVDDSDPAWQASREEYSLREKGESGAMRFRDWGTLKYWFRGIEKFAPWVNRIFFVTCGHYPDWLNLNHPKLRFVKHSDYIPTEYLPTFNSHTIELNLHRIKELSEKFVYFNDDIFLIDHIPAEHFFKDDLPCDLGVLTALQPQKGVMSRIFLNDVAFINSHFSKEKSFKENRKKWFSLKYGKLLLRTLVLKSYPRFTGFIDPHLPNAFLKSSFAEAWSKDYEVFDQTCKNRFRSDYDLNQYAIRYLQIVTGKYMPCNTLKEAIIYRELEDGDVEKAARDIVARRQPVMCINDGPLSDFEGAKKLIRGALEKILPEKSGFEI